MTLTEQFSNNETVKQKAAAFDKMQREAELAKVYNQGNGDAYEAGRRDTAAELNALMQEGLAQQMADPRMYDVPAIPNGMVQGTEMYQGDQVPQDPNLATSRETALPAPEGLAARMVR